MPTFKTMLAGKAPDLEKLKYPLYASPKLDGIRCHVINGRAVSRNGKEFPNPELQWVFGNKDYEGLDGEFIFCSPTDPAACRMTQSVTSSHTGGVLELRLHVFDDFTNPDAGFEERLKLATRRCKMHPHLIPVKHVMIYSSDDLTAYESTCVSLGYEGIMTRTPDGPYKYGRATPREQYLLKVKRFEDSEAVIDGVEELMHNANEKTLVKNGKATRNSKKEGKVGRGTLGALVVRDTKTGVDFNIGTGFDDAERAAFWKMYQDDELIGKVVTYRYFPTGSKTRPRFPSFVAFRDDI